MSNKALNAEIKTRVPKGIKKEFLKLAAERDLKPADLQREAFREFLSRHSKAEERVKQPA